MKSNENGRMGSTDNESIIWIDVNNTPARISDTEKIPDDKWPSNQEDVYGLKNALLKACNPVIFMKPDYNAGKVSSAIDIYKQIRTTDASDIATLGLLRRTAEDVLGIILNVNAFYHHLITIFSPEKYVNNYQEELLMKNHEICSRLTENKDSMDGLENVLMAIQKEEKEEQEKEKEKQEKQEQETKWVLYIIVITACIVGFTIILGLNI